MSVDYEVQKAETERLWAEMSTQPGVPAEGLLDLRFVADAGAGADATEFMGWLEDRGYDVEYYPADPDSDDPEDALDVIEVQTDVMPLSAATIHAEERKTTEAALGFGFRPDGWGFMGA
ncbi:Regulator of ribonuclease activity B [Jannaschia faecimaris]|uniref:Regulator of ribonuclease activity B n=1 Tax=Jannaschia faecimaris TaxID=1244108 RepID=A0A1H3L1U1_9RHOB|nr:ribonuclease E inhibitor RraB [Jannaschia faecimaris]SDY57918.1 Regulator of ribonuclease activity B [Jannaschia faecimaris]